LIRKTSVESLQEEFGRERAEVLASAGNNVAEIIQEMQRKSQHIADKVVRLREFQGNCVNNCAGKNGLIIRKELEQEIDDDILLYDKLRNQALLRYYYLVVTREALGLRNHQWVKDIYRIPDIIKPLDYETSLSLSD